MYVLTFPLIAETNFVALYLVLAAIAFGVRQSLLSVAFCSALLVCQRTLQWFGIISAFLNGGTLLKVAGYCLIGISVRRRFKLRSHGGKRVIGLIAVVILALFPEKKSLHPTVMKAKLNCACGLETANRSHQRRSP